MAVLMPVAAAVFFAVWHSFCDALAWRIYEAFYSPRRKQVADKYGFVLGGSSRCEACSAPVSIRGLVPVVGFFLVKGRCERCTRPISWRFPVFEALAAVYGLTLGLKELAPAEFVLATIVYALIWVVIATDYRVLLIPTEAILGLLITGLVGLLLIRYPQWYRFESIDLGLDLAVAFVWYALFHLLRIASGYKMGLADVRLVLALGFLLGHPLALYLPGFAAMLAICFYLLRRYSVLIYAPSETQIPFGVFLGVGYLLLSLVRNY